MSIERVGIAPGAYFKGIEIEENTISGSTTTWLYEGSKVEVDAQRALHLAMGATRISRAPKGDGNYELRASYPYGELGAEAEEPQNVYELEISVAQPSVYQNPKLRSLLSDQLIGKVAKIAQGFEAGDYMVDADPSYPDTAAAEAAVSTATSANATALKLFKLVAYRKTDSFIEYETVFRRSITAASPNQIRAGYEGVGKIWTTDEVQAFEKVVPGGWFILEPDMQWLKAKPNVVSVSNQKTQINYYYTQLKSASALLYDAYGDAVLLDA
ncbi:MAG: hypothetical protein ACTHLW_02160 [Verrucomicrobiota bacterium]